MDARQRERHPAGQRGGRTHEEVRCDEQAKEDRHDDDWAEAQPRRDRRWVAGQVAGQVASPLPPLLGAEAKRSVRGASGRYRQYKTELWVKYGRIGGR